MEASRRGDDVSRARRRAGSVVAATGRDWGGGRGTHAGGGSGQRGVREEKGEGTGEGAVDGSCWLHGEATGSG
eukprot:478686-Pleurochrysis_carterae.AAC.2